MYRRHRLFYLLLFVATIFLSGCANPVTPTGGPKDEKPPKVLACEPAVNSIHFNASGFRIVFDEFIALKNPLTEIYISPQLKKPLDTKLHGKSLVIDFDDTLTRQTTYSVNFGNAITDISEGNILKGFNYVFSTGNYIDSLSLQGTLLSAFDHSPQKDAFVGIYLRNNDTIPPDSMPIKVPPYYITRTNELGRFIFNNIQNARCNVFALADQNSDLIFNQPTEKIAFLDSLVDPFYIRKIIQDTTSKVDTVKKPDTIHPGEPQHRGLMLYMFTETDSIQRLIKASFPNPYMAELVFKQPAENLKLTPLNFDSAANWFIPEYSANHDSLTLWITRKETDSIKLRLSAVHMDIDTIDLALPIRDKSENNKTKHPENQLRISSPSSGISFNQFKNKMILTWSTPLTKAEFKRVLIFDDKDTVHPSVSFADSLHRRIRIDHQWKEEKTYNLLFPDSTFFGINGISHDTIRFTFRSKAEKDYGNLLLSFNLPEYQGNYIVQLMNEKESIILEQKVVTGPGKIKFEFMSAGKYKLKAIKDRNRNGKWDSGNFRKRIQPEEVIYLPKAVEIRSNWDVEEVWN